MFVLKTWKNYWENNEEREHTLKSSKIRFWLKKLDGNAFCFHFWNLITACHLCQVQNYCINLDNLAHSQYTQPSIHFKRRFFSIPKSWQNDSFLVTIHQKLPIFLTRHQDKDKRAHRDDRYWGCKGCDIQGRDNWVRNLTNIWTHYRVPLTE